MTSRCSPSVRWSIRRPHRRWKKPSTDCSPKKPKALIVDLSAVTFLASVGLRLLVSTHEKVSKSGEFAVVASGPITSRPIRLTRLDQVFAMYPTLDEALAGVRTRMVNGQ